MADLTEKLQVYKCDICGNIVLVLHAGAGKLVCCGQPMTLVTEKTGGPGSEKHMPVANVADGNLEVKVGSVEHPMEEGHYIEWIEVIASDNVLRRFLRPGDKPEAKFPLTVQSSEVEVRAYCNKHGLWKTSVQIR